MQRLVTRSNKEILFVNPPSRFNTHRYNIAYLYLASYLHSKGYDSLIIEPHVLLNKKYKYHDIDEYGYKRIIANLASHIRKTSPKIVCFNAYTHEFMEIVDLIKLVKKNSNAKVVVGGYHPSAKPLEFLDYGADFSVFGEGEFTLHELVETLYNGNHDFHKIDGLAWKNGSKKILNHPRTGHGNLDDFPIPTYDKIDMKRYLSIWDGTVRGFPLRAATMITSRGCPFMCSFCGCNRVFGRKIRFRTGKDIEKEVKLLVKEYDIEAIMFFDDTLTVNKKHARMVARIMKKYGLLWDCQARVDSLDDKLVKYLKDRGCVQIDFGVESGSQRILDEIIHKGTKVEDASKVFKLCRKYGIHPMANFMIGLPTETAEEMEESFKLAKDINASYYFFSVVCPLPGTDLYDMIGIDVKPDKYYRLN